MEPDFEIQYGLYDTEDDVWMGDDNGPKTFTDFMHARVASEVVDVRRPGRTKAREYDPAPKRLRDEVPTKMTTEEALRRMENGLVN
jgi:hypothetical protein